MNKQKLLDALKKDIECGKLKMSLLFPVENPREVVTYHIIRDEIEYILSLISTIEEGTYD